MRVNRKVVKPPFGPTSCNPIRAVRRQSDEECSLPASDGASNGPPFAPSCWQGWQRISFLLNLDRQLHGQSRLVAHLPGIGCVQERARKIDPKSHPEGLPQIRRARVSPDPPASGETTMFLPQECARAFASAYPVQYRVGDQDRRAADLRPSSRAARWPNRCTAGTSSMREDRSFGHCNSPRIELTGMFDNRNLKHGFCLRPALGG